MEYFIFNGKMLKPETGIIGANSRGLRFGDGLFETIKSTNGHLEFIDEHFARLWKGMQVLQFAIPKQFTPDYLEQEIQNLLKKSGHDKMARVRITVFRGDGGLYDATDHKPNYLVQSWALPDETGRWNSNGLVVGIYTDVKKSCDILSNLKHNNFLPYALAALQAKKEKWNDSLLLNTEGRLCDTTIANIFLIKDDVVYTPALPEGCIAGVMRRNLVEKLTAAGYKLVEGRLSVDELLNADEVFLTNSIYYMRWVQSIGDKKYSNAQTQKIYAAFFSTNS
jgi:branched-chain amino acid aminotransferase